MLIETDLLVSSSLSDVGRTRSENQDACGEFYNSAGERLLIVADGMGGHAGGVTASRLCVETVARVFGSGQGTPDERLRRGFEEANRVVHGAAEADPALHGMGTTGVALLFAPGGTVWLAWVGDSRAYRFRGGQLEQLSEDHSVVADWVRMGDISAEEAKVHPRRNELSRAIGPERGVEVDLRSYSIELGDYYLLCSDGLCGYMSDSEISAIVGFESPDDAVHQLVNVVNVECGSPDNVTVQIVAVPSDITNTAAAAPGLSGRATAVHQEGSSEMGDTQNANGNAGYPRTKKMVAVGIAVLIVAALLAGVAWHEMSVRRAEEVALVVAEAERQAALEQAARTKRESERLAALAAELEAKTVREEAARAESARLAAVARVEAAAREEALTRQIAETKAALVREQEAADAAAREAALKEAADREKILAERESRRLEEIARKKALAIEAALNMAREVDRFVGQWSQALDQGDYSLYQELGFRESESEFNDLYGDRNAEYQIAVLEKLQWEGGFVALRVTETYDPPGTGPGFESREIQRRLVLRPTSDGMRYAGDRE